jgi:hypothetical protein
MPALVAGIRDFALTWKTPVIPCATPGMTGSSETAKSIRHPPRLLRVDSPLATR